VCGSITDIQSATAESRRGKKERKKERRIRIRRTARRRRNHTSKT